MAHSVTEMARLDYSRSAAHAPPMGSAAASRRNPRQERSKITVQAILEAAARVFTAQGFQRTLTNRVALQAGVSVGSLYQYFPDKLALLSALHECHLRMLMEAMTAAGLTREVGLEPALRAIIQAAAAHHRTHAALVRLFVRNLPRDQKPSRASTEAFQSALRALLVRHRGELRIVDYDFGLFVLRNLGRSMMQAAAESRVADLENGLLAREVLATAVFFLTGRPLMRKQKGKRRRTETSSEKSDTVLGDQRKGRRGKTRRIS